MRLAQLLLHPSGRRVELYVRPSRTDTRWVLVALAGAPAADGTLRPEPPETQGPYRDGDEAGAALDRIIALLVERGFAMANDQLQWELLAARAVRAVITESDRPPTDATASREAPQDDPEPC